MKILAIAPARMVRYGASVLTARSARATNRPIHPRFLHFQVTERCNLRCPLCIYGTNQTVRRKSGSYPEISPTEAGELFRDPGLQHLDVIRLTGGEPLLRGDLHALVSAIHQAAHPDLIYLTTNATLPDRLEELLAHILPRGIRLQLQLSIDGVGNAHDRNRGVPGTFKEVAQSITIIHRYRERYPFFAGINCTIFENNLGNAKDVARLARRNGFGFRMVIAARYSENTKVDISPLEQAVPFLPAFPVETSRLEEIYNQITSGNSLKMPGILSRSSLWELGNRYLVRGEKNRALRGKANPRPPCTALFSHFRLFPDGEVIPCIGLKTSIGNIREESFSRIWKSHLAREIRKLVKTCRGCWIECDILPSAFYSGAIFPWVVSHIVTSSFLRRFYSRRPKTPGI